MGDVEVVFNTIVGYSVYLFRAIRYGEESENGAHQEWTAFGRLVLP